jgi:hypothetical protein
MSHHLSHDDDRPVIRLWDAGLGVIILWPSHVVYSNQTGGYACLQPREEGVFVPLYADHGQQAAQFEAFFTGPTWDGGCCNGIDAETADYLDRLCAASFSTRLLHVDRTRLHDSHEAWIYVDVGVIEEQAYSHTILNFGQQKGVLTWANSD